MAQPLNFPARPIENTSENAEKPIYLRQEHEPQMWFNRFLLYRNLGPKRTVKAALEQERGRIKALKSTASKNGKATKGDREIQIPGSWKKACIQWRWIERAQAWDEHICEKMVDDYVDKLYAGYGAKEHRVWELHQMVLDLRMQYKVAKNVQERCLVAGRIQSLLRDIREEMIDYDRQVSHHVLNKQAKKMMRETPDVANPFTDRDE